MAVLTHTVHDYFPLGSPIYYDQGWKYDATGLKYDGSMTADSLTTKEVGMSQTETFGITDAGFTKVSTFIRSKADRMTISDAVGTKAIGIFQTDTFAISDTINTKAIGMSQADTMSLIDNGFTKVWAIVRSKSDSVTITDTGEIKTISLQRTDSVIITDNGEVKTIGKPLSDVLAIVEIIAKEVGIPLSDTVDIADTLAKVTSFKRSFDDTLTITDAGYTYYVPGEKAVFFISKEDVLANTGENKPSVRVLETAATAVPGIKPVYDGSLKYDTSGLYYDKWYSESGDLTQGEKPKMTVTEKNVKINVSSDKATIKKISKQRC